MSYALNPKTSRWVAAAALMALSTTATAGHDDNDAEDDAPRKGLHHQPFGHHPPLPMPFIQLQTWATAWDQDEDPQADPGGYGDPEHDPGFSIPRTRLGFAGNWGFVQYGLTVGTTRPYDAVSPAANPFDLIDAWGGVKFSHSLGSVEAAIGSHKIPFSREGLMSSSDLVFQERAVSTNWLSPLRDAGASASASIKWFTLSAGIYNGNGDILGDNDPGLLSVGRLELNIGGDAYTTQANDNALGIGFSVLNNDQLSTSTLAVNVDLLARVKGFTLIAEGNRTVIAPKDDTTLRAPEVPAQTTRLGGFIQVGYHFQLPTLGAIEPAVRFGVLDDASHLTNNGDVGVIHSGLSWREPLPMIDVGAVYIHRLELAGRPIDNDTFRIFVQVKYPPKKAFEAWHSDLKHGDAPPAPVASDQVRTPDTVDAAPEMAKEAPPIVEEAPAAETPVVVERPPTLEETSAPETAAQMAPTEPEAPAAEAPAAEEAESPPEATPESGE